MSEPNQHDRDRALVQAVAIAQSLLSADRVDMETARLVIAKVEAAILSCVTAKGEPLPPWERELAKGLV